MNGKYISAGKEFCTLEKHINAPYFRAAFNVNEALKSAVLTITGLGIYEAHINGKNITKGYFAPYRSNPEHIVYFDEYDILPEINKGKNILGVILGNGFQNPFGEYMWDFDKAVWRSAPKLCFEIQLCYKSGRIETVISDENVKTHPSPILFDDWHYGEYYDASLEITDWDMPFFDDGGWANSIIAETPNGEMRLCEAEPIVLRKKLNPVSVTRYNDGFIYDFGLNNAGLCELNIENTQKGQKILLRHFEVMKDGKPFLENIRFYLNGVLDCYQEDIYYCDGREKENYIPHFSYHGFRYVYVEGITEKQATNELLTYLVINSDIKQIGSFSCDSEIVNKLQEATVRSELSNFYYFPTDCPHREKNGWTADASLSVEHTLLNLKAETSYKEWMRNIEKAVSTEGKIPGIIPTAGWGYDWGNGPAWDNVIVNIPFYTYIYRGDSSMFPELSEPLMRYLKYLETRRDENGLISIGLGDWCPVGRGQDKFETPLIVTDSILTYDIAKKAMLIYEVLGQEKKRSFAEKLAIDMKKSIKENLIDHKNSTVLGDTQTAQAMALYYGIFEENEKPKAVNRLLKLIDDKDGHFDTGVLGGRVIFRVLADNGYADLALNMIIRPDFPSYGNWIIRGATTLWESFHREGGAIQSQNHHFWGDISAWFYTYLAGIRINPTGRNIGEVNIEPCFVEKLNFVSAKHQHPHGEISVEWKRQNSNVILNIKLPQCIQGKIILPNNNSFEIGETLKSFVCGKFIVNILK